MAKSKPNAAPAQAAAGAVGAIAGTNTTQPQHASGAAIVAAPAAGAAAPSANEGSTPPAGGVDQDFTVTHLQVSAKKDGFRRAGRAWPAREVTVSIDDFSMAQIQALIAEPMLVVVPVAGAE